MSEAGRNGNAPTPAQRDVDREARRLARVRRLRLVVNEPSAAPASPPAPAPRDAA
jgi:hypothetical protein